MAINSQKLLPPSKSVGGKIVKADSLSIVERKLVNVDKLFKNNLILQKKKVADNKKYVENKKREDAEVSIERKNKLKLKIKTPSFPKTGFLDAIQNFISYTFLGYLIGNYYQYFPKLLQFSKNITPAVTLIKNIVVGTFEGTVALIDFGYKANDEIKKFVKSVGGKDAEKTFIEFTNNFRNLINRVMTLGLYNPTPAKSNGGLVKKMAVGGSVTTRGGKVIGGAVTRKIKVTKIKQPPRIRPQQTIPGKDVGGKEKIKTVFPNPAEGINADNKAINPLRSLKTTSKTLKQIPLIGAVMGAAVDIAMGQKPDRNVYLSFGNTIGSLIQNSIDNETNSTARDITKTIFAMTNGGIVPRESGGRRSIGEEVGMQIAKMFEISLNNKINSIFNQIIKEMSGTPGMGQPTGEGFEGGGGFGAGGYAQGSQHFASSKEIYAYLKSKGLSHNHIMGMLANIQAESSFNAGAIGDNGTSGGLFQHHAERFKGMVAFAGKDWAKNWKGQIDYALREASGKQYVSKQFKSAAEASAWFTLNFERPANAAVKARERIDNIQNFNTDGSWRGVSQVPPGKVRPTITGRFGEMRSTGRHGGTDLAAPEGTPLVAISDGQIVESRFESGWGNYLVFKDNQGIYHLYGHMQRRSQVGRVRKGTIIGRVGSTGRITGPHLHWEAGTGWNGTIQGKFDPLQRYSPNAPFNTQQNERTRTVPRQTLPNRIPRGRGTEEYLREKGFISSTPTRPRSTELIASNASYDTNQEVVLVLKEKITYVPVNNSSASYNFA